MSTDQLQTLLFDRGRVLDVIDLSDVLPMSFLALRLEEGTTVLAARSVDDTVVVGDAADLASIAEEMSPWEVASITSACDRLAANRSFRPQFQPHPTLLRLVGGSVMWAWFLVNNLGHRDGLQIEMSDKDHDGSTVQLIVSGSRFLVSEVVPHAPVPDSDPGSPSRLARTLGLDEKTIL